MTRNTPLRREATALAVTALAVTALALASACGAAAMTVQHTGGAVTMGGPKVSDADDLIDGKATDTHHCLEYCSLSVGACGDGNARGCACAAGCACDGFLFDRCADHCTAENDEMRFYYALLPNPKQWTKTVGHTVAGGSSFLGASIVTDCYAGCARRGRCATKYCPKHPRGNAKCADCARRRSSSSDDDDEDDDEEEVVPQRDEL